MNPADDFTRQPPHDIAAEQVTLGGMLLSADAIGDVINVIRPGDHYRPAHQIVHEAVIALHDRSEPTDVVAVAAELTKRGEVGKVGGLPYLHTLTAAVPVAANAGYYARIVAEKATLRRLIETGTRIVQSGYAADTDADVLVDRARQDVDDITVNRSKSGSSFRDLLTEALLTLEEEVPRGVETPWNDLNNLAPLTGFTVIAARPAVGKSVAGMNIAAHVAASLHEQAVIFSLEMSRDELMMRLLSAKGRIPLNHLLHRQLDADDWDRLAKVSAWIGDIPLVINDFPGASLSYMRSTLRDLSRQRPVGIVIVDYLQLMTPPKRTENRQQEVAALSRGLKLLQRDIGVPVVAMAQLNRGPEQRAAKRPQLSDLRESGQIEADADNVWLLHRDDVVDKASARAGEIDVIVAKQRNGPTGTITLAFQGHYSRMVDMTRSDQAPSTASAGN